MGHVIMNRKKKWFRLTVDANAVRLSLLGLLTLNLSNSFLYAMAYANIFTNNRDRVEKIIVREEFLKAGKRDNSNRVV